MEDVTQDLFGILVIVNMNVINYVMFDNIQVIKIVSAEKNLVDRLAEECSENIVGNKMICNSTLNDYGNICNSCTVYIVLLVILFTISISSSSNFIYFHWYLKRRYSETTIY